MKQPFAIFLSMVLLIATSSTLANDKQISESITSTPITIGHEIKLFSKVLDEERRLLIRLPANYSSQPDKRYPVIYTLDGETHFSHVSGTINWLSQQTVRMPEMIVVAITNTRRGRDMSATYNGGGSDKFIKFINQELLPFVDKTYRTQPFRILSGHSMAGHLTLNLMHQSPDSFNAYIAMSPWFRQDDDIRIHDLIKNKLPTSNYYNKFLYLSIGEEPRLSSQYNEFTAILKKHAPELMYWYSQPSNSDDHMSVVTATLNNALQYIFAPQKLEPDSFIAQKGIDSIRDYYNQLSTKIYGYYLSPEVAITRYGFNALDNNYFDKAIDILTTNTKLFPESSAAFDALANALHRDNQLLLAHKAINQAIELGKQHNQNALRWYERRKTRIESALTAEKAKN